MLSLATQVKALIPNEARCNIDSFIAPLHYRATAALLMICCAVVSSQQYFGSPIECIQDINGDDAVIPVNVINNFCFISGTYTKRDALDGHLSTLKRGDEGTQLHTYYQWVPIVLFLQAVLFTLPRAVWAQIEGGLMFGCVKTLDKKNKFPSEQAQQVPPLARYICGRLHSLTIWSLWNVGHDMLNFLNVVFNIYLINIFLNKQFFNFGSETTKYLLGHEMSVSPLEKLFPKLSKCEFHKYGASGTIQRHDVLCLMAMNIINEKLYYILWLWLSAVAYLTALHLSIRLLKIVLLAARFRMPTLRRLSSLYDDSAASRILLDNASLSDIIFMEQLKVNMDNKTFKLLIETVADFLNSSNFELDNKYSKLI